MAHMLYGFFGTDTVGVRERAHTFVVSHEEKGSELVRILPEQFVPSALEDAAGSTSLFGNEYIFVIDTPSEDSSMFEYVFGHLDMLKESPHTFVIIEGGLKASEKKVLTKSAEELVEVTGGKAERFNMFGFADALGRRDKKSLWILFATAKGRGVSAEEIIGILFWQLKVLRLVSRTSSPEESGQKPFVFNKAKSALKKFKDGELDALSRSLLTLYHDGHSGAHDIDLALERWVLKV